MFRMVTLDKLGECIENQVLRCDTVILSDEIPKLAKVLEPYGIKVVLGDNMIILKGDNYVGQVDENGRVVLLNRFFTANNLI